MTISHCRQAQRGATLIEVLVSLLVFSIGIYGVASFQLQAVKEGVDSNQRSQAVWAAQETIDRMRLNTTGYIAGEYQDAFDGIDCETPPNPYCADTQGADATACSASQMADFDAWEVQCQTAAGLPDVNFDLSCADIDTTDADDCTRGSDFTLTVSWQSKSVADDTEISDDDDLIKNQQFIQVFRP